MKTEERKKAAVEFLRMAAGGKAREAMRRFMAPGAKHHNQYFPAGMEALAQALEAAAWNAPDTRLDVKHVLADGDLVAVHSHVVMHPGEPGVAVVHMFRFEGDRVAEFWDVGQELTADSPNADGMF